MDSGTVSSSRERERDTNARRSVVCRKQACEWREIGFVFLSFDGDEILVNSISEVVCKSVTERKFFACKQKSDVWKALTLNNLTVFCFVVILGGVDNAGSC